MIPQEILRKVRRIELRTRSLVEDVFAGEYHSVFKGRGMEFAEVREYIPGDDIRAIDWNVTARMSQPFVKIFDEERELTVMLLVDLSGSARFGSQERSKGVTAGAVGGESALPCGSGVTMLLGPAPEAYAVLRRSRHCVRSRALNEYRVGSTPVGRPERPGGPLLRAVSTGAV